MQNKIWGRRYEIPLTEFCTPPVWIRFNPILHTVPPAPPSPGKAHVKSRPFPLPRHYLNDRSVRFRRPRATTPPRLSTPVFHACLPAALPRIARTGVSWYASDQTGVTAVSGAYRASQGTLLWLCVRLCLPLTRHLRPAGRLPTVRLGFCHAYPRIPIGALGYRRFLTRWLGIA